MIPTMAKSPRLVPIRTRLQWVGVLFMALSLSACTSLEGVGGPSWVAVPSGTSRDLLGVASDGNGFVAVGGGIGTSVILVSRDGTRWDRVNYDAQAQLTSVAYGDGRYIAVGFDNTVLVSSDGTSWQRAYGPSLGYFNRVAFGGGRFVAVSAFGFLLVSADATAQSWQVVRMDTGAAMDLAGVTYGNGRWVVVGQLGQIWVSEDALAWRQVPSGVQDNLSWVTYGNGRFVASPYSGSYLLTSEDGLTWTRRDGVSAIAPSFGGGTFVAASGHSDNKVLVSEDGLVWREESLSESAFLRAFAYAEGLRRWVAVGWGGKIFAKVR